MVTRENKNNAYAKFWEAKEECSGIFPNWPIGMQCDFSLQRVLGTKITRLAFAFSEVSV